MTQPNTEPNTQTDPQQNQQPSGEPNQQQQQSTAPPAQPQAPSFDDILKAVSAFKPGELMKIPAVQTLVEGVRTEEKNKLYKSLTEAENKVKDLELKLTDASNKLKDYETSNLSAEQRLADEIKTLKDEHEALVLQLQKDKDLAEATAQAEKLKAYKEAKLREAGDEIVPELVGGDTEEEIDASVEKAIAKYQEIASKFEAKAKDEKKTNVKQTTKATAPSASSMEPITRSWINSLSTAEYAKHRDRIIAASSAGQIIED
jgi:DNA repair exonuclease SbcCD ATPase subunit